MDLFLLSDYSFKKPLIYLPKIVDTIRLLVIKISGYLSGYKFNGLDLYTKFF
jgi:hypothetical protein